MCLFHSDQIISITRLIDQVIRNSLLVKFLDHIFDYTSSFDHVMPNWHPVFDGIFVLESQHTQAYISGE